MLDSEEYFHLAVHAAQNGLHHSAMEYLYKCLEEQPENANAIFLLAAEHAELGLYKRAIEGMRKSIELDDKLEMAYYQLALLYLQEGDAANAYSLWQYLSAHGIDPVLREFAKGMLLSETDPEKALGYLDKARAMPQLNNFLEKSMNEIADSLRFVVASPRSADALVDGAAHEILVNTYKKSSFNRDDNE